jgi:hypothetical protein
MVAPEEAGVPHFLKAESVRTTRSEYRAIRPRLSIGRHTLPLGTVTDATKFIFIHHLEIRVEYRS